MTCPLSTTASIFATHLLRPLLGVALVASVGCSAAPASDGSSDDAADELRARKCQSLVVSTGAKLLPAGAHQADVGTFELLYSERSVDEVTGPGPWSAWRSYDAGTVQLTTGHDPENGPMLTLSLIGTYYPQTGRNQANWGVGAKGFFTLSAVAERNDYVTWYVQGGAPGNIVLFDTKDIVANTCQWSATSIPRQDTRENLNREYRFQVHVKFKR